MKIIINLLLVFGSLTAYCQDYTIRINDTTFDIHLDKKYDLVLNGKKVSFSVSSHDILKYTDSIVRFMYPKDLKPNAVQIETGVKQITVITGEGNGFIVQEYGTMNPGALNEFMMNEVTKESIGYGYTSVRKDYKKTLKSGQSVDVSRAVLTYKEDIYIYEVASVGKKDEGVMIITMLLNDKVGNGKKNIDLFWDSFEYR